MRQFHVAVLIGISGTFDRGRDSVSNFEGTRIHPPTHAGLLGFYIEELWALEIQLLWYPASYPDGNVGIISIDAEQGLNGIYMKHGLLLLLPILPP